MRATIPFRRRVPRASTPQVARDEAAAARRRRGDRAVEHARRAGTLAGPSAAIPADRMRACHRCDPGHRAMAPMARAVADVAARHLRTVRFPFPAVSRAALRAARRGESRQLPVAAADRRADPGAAARVAPHLVAWTGGGDGSCGRGAGDRRRAGGADTTLHTWLRARSGIGDGLGMLFAALPARATVFIMGDRRVRGWPRAARAPRPRVVLGAG